MISISGINVIIIARLTKKNNYLILNYYIKYDSFEIKMYVYVVMFVFISLQQNLRASAGAHVISFSYLVQSRII